MPTLLSNTLDEIISLIDLISLDAVLQEALQDAKTRALSVLRNGNKLLFAGNGGSAAEAQHMAAEYVSRFKFDRPGLAAIALTTDTSILTAIGNDYGYDNVFSRQIEAIGRPGDLLFLSSTSGRSPNVLKALSAARQTGVATVLLTGGRYQAMETPPDVLIVVPSVVTARVQEMHLVLGHCICEFVENGIFGS